MEPEFKVTVKRFHGESYEGRPSVIGEWINQIPSYPSIVRSNGIGYYRYAITYKKGSAQKLENIDVPLVTPSWQEIELEGTSDRKKRRLDALKQEAEERDILRQFGSSAPVEKESLADQIKGIAPLLELIKGSPAPVPTSDTNMFMMMMQMQQQAQQANRDLMGKLLIAVAPKVIDMFMNRSNSEDKVFSMVERFIGMRDALTPKEETLIDKVGGFLGNNLPIIMELLAKPAGEREQSAIYQKVAGDPKTQKIVEKMQGNEDFAKKLINHLDGRLGKDTTDKILDGFLKYRRHDAVPQEVPIAQESDELTDSDFDE